MASALQRAGVTPRLAREPVRSGALGLMALLSGACSGDPIARIPAFVLGEAVEVALQAGPAAGLQLFRAAGLKAAGPDLLVIDAGNHRLLRLDAELRPVGEVGSKGAGPGEFGFVLDASVRGDTVVVGDLTNGRFMAFDWRQGTEISTAPAPGIATTLAWLEDGSLFAPVLSADQYLARVGPDGTASGFAARPAVLRTDRVTTDDRVAGCGHALHVLDDRHGVLLRYSAAGDLIDAHRLPDPVRTDLLNRRQRTLERFTRRGYRVAGVPLVKQLVAISCERILVLFGHDRLFGLLVDHADASARPLLLPRDVESSRPLRAATAVLPLPDRLIVLADDQVLSYAYH
jgi:hypothetical protein